MHYIQKHILKTLTYTKNARFRDMRPPKVDSNAYSYHLRVLQKEGMVEKSEEGYRLSPIGLSYVDKISTEKFELRAQPKLTHMLVIKNELGQVLLISKTKQPFIDTWMLPNGKVHLDDQSFFSGAVREAEEKLNFIPENLVHRGSCYIRASVNGKLVSSIVANVFEGTAHKKVSLKNDAAWYDIKDMPSLPLAPAVLELTARVVSSRDQFNEQFDIDW